MAHLASGSLGVLLGVIHARLALQPLLTLPFRISPAQLVSRFLLRLLALSVVLVLVAVAGAPMIVLLPCLVGGFVTHSAVILMRGVS